MSPSASTSSRRTITGFYVASTHWDREWYEPFQHYRIRLLHLFDTLIDLMERDADYQYFMTDGQSCILEDYLEIRPEQRERLQALFDAGRLQAGPWYVMPDEFIPCGESLVRNLLRGFQVAAQFGPPMKHGFMSDIFGHHSQMPQILRGFGIDTAIVWRGTNEPTHPGLFRWRGADGSDVLTYTFEDRGYGQYQFEVRNLGHRSDGTLDLDHALEGLRKLYKMEAGRVPGNAILLFDGMDHIMPEPATSELLARARKSRLRAVHGTLSDFFAAVRDQKLRLKTFAGELRAPAIRAGEVIQGVLSSRIYLKQYNARCESSLLQWSEPFGVCASLLGERYPDRLLAHAWKHLLHNHPHDSICGCSIDQVHQDMMYRFDQCRLISERTTQMSLRAIADHTPLPQLAGDEDFAVTVFNPSDRELDEVVDIPLYFRRDTPYRYTDWFGYEPVIGFRLYDPKGREQRYQRLDVRKLAPQKTFDPLVGYWGEKCERVRVATHLKIPPRGWTTLTCRPTMDRTRTAGSQLVDDHTMENALLRVTVNPNGTLDIHDRRTDHTYRNVLTFEERADIGDGWYHGTAVNDHIHSSFGSAADVAVLHDGPAQTTLRVRLVMNVPARFLLDKQVMERSQRLTPLVITNDITMRAGSPLLKIHTHIDNTARDHRVRVLMPTHLDAATYHADSPFDVMQRQVGVRPDSHELYEPELETKPQYTFTALSDDQRGLAVIAPGQPESAVCDRADRAIALTLFRGFTRVVANERNEGGQMLGPTAHTYWVYPFQGPVPVSELCHLGQRLAGGVACIYTDRTRLSRLPAKAVLPAVGSWLKTDGGPAVIAACKRSEDGKALVVRAFNPTDKKASQRFEFVSRIRSAQRANLLEQPAQALAPRGRRVTVSFGPKEILTLRVQLEPLK